MERRTRTRGSNTSSEEVVTRIADGLRRSVFNALSDGVYGELYWYSAVFIRSALVRRLSREMECFKYFIRVG